MHNYCTSSICDQKILRIEFTFFYYITVISIILTMRSYCFPAQTRIQKIIIVKINWNN